MITGPTSALFMAKSACWADLGQFVIHAAGEVFGAVEAGNFTGHTGACPVAGGGVTLDKVAVTDADDSGVGDLGTHTGTGQGTLLRVLLAARLGVGRCNGDGDGFSGIDDACHLG